MSKEIKKFRNENIKILSISIEKLATSTDLARVILDLFKKYVEKNEDLINDLKVYKKEANEILRKTKT